MKTKSSTRNAFTLIELLIVVAIIAILAAIAVPNFLEAQVRAKISRAKADMRSMVVAIESYVVDYNKYPLSANELGGNISPYPSAGPAVFETRVSVVITTPVAYITSRLQEPFPAGGGSENQHYHYGSIEYALDRDGTGGRDDFLNYSEMMLFQKSDTAYLMLSHGPDLDHDDPALGLTSPYDSTNGTISDGDILYFGPGVGFAN